MRPSTFALALAFVAAFCGTARATEIAFTGGSDGSSRDLALAANWAGGALPSGAGVTGVVDMATFGASYTVSTAAALDGLKFGNASSAFTINGTGTLSLGAGGLTVDGTGTVTLRAPMAVTAASTWQFGGGQVESYATISGTADLTFAGWSRTHWRNAPRYGGKMTMNGNADAAYIHVWEGATWANTVDIQAGGIVWRFGGRVKFSTLFPGKSLTHSVWADVSFDCASGGTLVIEEGDTFHTTGNFNQVANGALEMSGGSYRASAAFIMGGVGGTGCSTQNGPSSVLLSGGSFEGNQVNIGYNATTNRLFRQTGGDILACTYNIGGGKNYSGTTPVMEYRQEGGSMLDKNGAARDRGLILGGHAAGTDNNSAPGIYTMTGGMANFTHVRWGANGGFWTWDDTSTTPNGRAYGLLDLRGGDFLIPPAGFQLTPMWNGGTVSNSAYDVRLSGGSIRPRSRTTTSLAMTIETGDGPSTIDTSGTDILVAAPVDGEGTLRKTGAGRLHLTDATRFKGSVKVDEGVLEVRGTLDAPAGYTEGENLRIFTADSLANTLADGDEVTSWSDSTGTLSCQKPVSGEISSPDTYAVPTFKPNIAKGHAALYFNKGHVLGFHPADNPLAGETNFSFAIVYRPTTGGVGRDGQRYAGRCIIGNESNWGSTGVNTIELIYTEHYRTTLHLRNNVPDIGSIGRTYMMPTLYQGYTEGEANISVAIVSMSGNRVVYNFNNCFTNCTFETITGNFNPRFMTSAGTKRPLYFGTSDVDNTGCQQVRCFGGYIYEVRFYKGRALTEAETRSVMDELTRKYFTDERADINLMESSGPSAASFADTRTAPAIKTPDAEWSPEFMDETFNAWDANYNKPELVPDVCNGKSALRFDATRDTVLKIPEGANQDPLAGCSKFAIAVVFRTTTEGTGFDDGSTGTGIYSSMLAGYGHNSGCGNAAISFREYGSVGGYLATSPGGGSLVNSHKPCRLNDGLPHVAVFTGDVDASTFRLMVDGVYTENTLGRGVTWPGYDSGRPHVIGALRAGVGHFTGDIMGFKFWKSTLTEDEMLAICQKAAFDYDFNLKERRAFTMSELTTRGISATNYTVAAGATLRMPLSATAPFTLGANVTLAGDGTFEGSYRFGAGSVLDFATLPANIEDVQVADGSRVKFAAGATPADGGNISSVSGTVTFDVSALPDAQKIPRIPLLRIAADRIAPGTEFQTAGAKSSARIEYEDGEEQLVLLQAIGTLMLFR